MARLKPAPIDPAKRILKFSDKILYLVSCILYLLQIFPEAPELSFSKIIQIVLIGIRFPFEWDSFISMIAVFQFEEPVIIFDDIENVEENNQHFQLLS